MADFKAILQSPDSIQIMGLSRQLRALVSATITCSWMTVQGVDAYHHTRQGTKPGDPFGDLFFC
eukprot:7899881-Lingulodinium_polyedra.AAC.1